MKKIKGLFLGLVAGLSAITLASCGTQKEADTMVTVKVNPEIALLTDGQTVTDVVALNDDADVVLSEEEENIEGKEVSDAVEYFVNVCVDMGYIDPETEGHDVYVNVESGSTSTETEIYNKVEVKVNNYFKNNGIYGKVSTDTCDKYANVAFELGRSNGEAKMIMLALELNSDLTLDDVKDLSTEELVKLIHENNNMSLEIKSQYKDNKASLKLEYSNMFTLEAEIDTIKARLEASNIDDTVKTVLLAQLAQLEETYKSLKEEYKEKLTQLHEEYKAKAEAYKEECKAEHDARIEAHKEEVKNHKENCHGNVEVEVKIEAYQKGNKKNN